MSVFPKDFLWGAATSSYQVEGFNENTDWAQAAKQGRVPYAGRLADHYHRYEEDFDIAKKLGHNAHRFSIEWARIEPQEGVFDQAEIEHYRQVLRALHARNITPMVTLWHFTLPLWFSESGGFERKDAAVVFARYCAHVVRELGDLCTHYATMNEPNVYASNGYLRGSWPPFKRFALTDMVSITNSGRGYKARAEKSISALFLYRKVMRTLAEAHNCAYDAIKNVAPEKNVSVVKHVIYFHANRNPFNMLRSWVANQLWTHVFMRRTFHKCDSIGLNYYFHKKFGDTEVCEKTDMDWDIYPQGLYDALRMLWKYKKPLYVSEAGLADAQDRYRAAYIQTQVSAVEKALSEGIDVFGHMYWSLIDNYEWALGIDKKFGLVEIDYQTLERRIRPSAWVYADLIKKHRKD